MDSKKNGEHRLIRQSFVEVLSTGVLRSFVQAINADNSLRLEIRTDRVILYYRGAKVLTIKERRRQPFLFLFNSAYFKQVSKITEPLPPQPHPPDYESLPEYNWVKAITDIKEAIDIRLHAYPKPEQDSAHSFISENSCRDETLSTHYFICDAEYTDSEGSLGNRPDLIGARICSENKLNKTQASMQLALFEMKYGRQAIRGAHGLEKHVERLIPLFRDFDYLEKLKSRMENVVSIKRDIGLLCNSRIPSEFRFGREANAQPEYLIVLADLINTQVSPDYKNSLIKTMANISRKGLEADVKVAFCYTGQYSLIPDIICGLDEFPEKLTELLDKSRSRAH